MAAKSSDWRQPGSNVCRCCFADGCYKDISTEYFWMGKREVYSEMLTETFDVNISYTKSGGPNSNSRLICEPCISRLRDATDFKKQVVECEKTFMQCLDPGRSNIELEGSSADKSVKVEYVKLEKELSDDDFDDIGNDGFGDDDDEDDDLDDQPLTKLASKIPKKESVDLMDLLDNDKAAQKRKASAPGLKIVVTKKAKTKKDAKPVASKVKAAPAKPEKKKKEEPRGSADEAGSISVLELRQLVRKSLGSNTTNPLHPEKNRLQTAKVRAKRVDPARQNAALLLKHSTAYPIRIVRRKLFCYFCVKHFEDAALFRVHYDKEHANVEKCTVLTRIPTAQTRVDVMGLRCKVCDKTFDCLDLLAEHLKSDHQQSIDCDRGLGLVPLKLEKDLFQCLICSKKFSGAQQLSRHTGTHFSRNICDVCGKGFETENGLYHHVDLHKQNHMCTVCKKSFLSADEKKRHVRESHRCKPFACQMCKERFLFWERRENHLVEVHGMERSVYRCTECGEVYNTRMKLYRHFKTTHTEDNKCQYCEQRFITKRKLREHTYSHTGERPLKCNVCGKTFAMKRSLSQHLVTHDDSMKLECGQCKKLFINRSKLNLHVKTRHRDVKEPIEK